MGHSSSFLRRVLLADGIVSGASGIVMLAGSSLLARIIGAPPSFIALAGASLLPFAAFVSYLSRRESIPRAGVWTVIALNAVWVAGSILLLFTDVVAPGTIGTAFIVAQAVAVAALAEMQYAGLRRAWS